MQEADRHSGKMLAVLVHRSGTCIVHSKWLMLAACMYTFHNMELVHVLKSVH
jgi:hypothetical protein